jgi:hypothetical protein
MANIFNLENFDDFSEKINIDELYEKKRLSDVNKLELFKKILNRIHIRIKTTARQNVTDRSCWFIVPEIIIGVPKYDQGACIAYVMDTLQKNGFIIKYFHPNTLFITWNHWVPTYVRNEIKKKTGLVINEYGEKIADEKGGDDSDDELTNNTNSNSASSSSSSSSSMEQIKNSKKYTPINSYKPSGKLVYSEDLLNKIENKMS